MFLGRSIYKCDSDLDAFDVWRLVGWKTLKPINAAVTMMTRLLSWKSDTKCIQNDLATFVIVEEIRTMCAAAEPVGSSY